MRGLLAHKAVDFLGAAVAEAWQSPFVVRTAVGATPHSFAGSGCHGVVMDMQKADPSGSASAF